MRQVEAFRAAGEGHQVGGLAGHARGVVLDAHVAALAPLRAPGVAQYPVALVLGVAVVVPADQGDGVVGVGVVAGGGLAAGQVVLVDAALVGVEGIADPDRGVDGAVGHDRELDGLDVAAGDAVPGGKARQRRLPGRAAARIDRGVGEIRFTRDADLGQGVQFGVVVVRALAGLEVLVVLRQAAQAPDDEGLGEVLDLGPAQVAGHVDHALGRGRGAEGVARAAAQLVAHRADVALALHVAPVEARGQLDLALEPGQRAELHGLGRGGVERRVARVQRGALRGRELRDRVVGHGELVARGVDDRPDLLQGLGAGEGGQRSCRGAGGQAGACPAGGRGRWS